MNKKLAHSLLLMVMVAAVMIGGDLVREGRREMWVDTTPGITAGSNQGEITQESSNKIDYLADMISDEVYIRTNDCPNAHRDF